MSLVSCLSIHAVIANKELQACYLRVKPICYSGPSFIVFNWIYSLVSMHIIGSNVGFILKFVKLYICSLKT